MNTMTEAELKIANILWDEPGISAMGLSARCEDLFGWKRSTTYTLLKRMRDKELVRLDEKGLTILVARDTYYREKTDEMIGTAYRGSLPMFMNAFMKGRKLTPEEAEELRELIDSYTEEK